MTIQVRRVVTGHDADGKAVVKYDEVSTNVRSSRPGQSAAVVWTTDSFPVDNDGETDEALRDVATTLKSGTVCRIIEYGPGVSPRNHRTDSIDYAFVLSGEIDMEMDDTEIHLRAGDCLVQRGTIHNWINRGTVPCVIAFAIVAAHPAVVEGRVLAAIG